LAKAILIDGENPLKRDGNYFLCNEEETQTKFSKKFIDFIFITVMTLILLSFFCFLIFIGKM